MQQLIGEVTGAAPHPHNLKALTEVFEVWNEARGERELPTRQDLRPEKLARWLPQIALLRRDNEMDDWVYTLQGSALVEHTGVNLTNQRLSTVTAQPGQAAMRMQVLRCAEILQPCWFFGIPSTFREYAKIDKLELPFGTESSITHILIAMFRNPPLGELAS